MLKNSIQIALRKLRQQLVLGILKIGGLGISICAVILMLLYINFQWQYDRFHKHGDRIYRLQTDQYTDGALTTSSALTYAGVGPMLKSTFSGVEDQVRLGKWIGNDIVIQYKGRAAREQHFYFADPSFFKVFSFDLKQGDPATALVQPNSIVLTEKVARNLFGEADPLGQQVTMESRKSLKVTGIMESSPIQSHLEFEMLASYSTLEAFGFDEESVYGGNHFDSFYTYAYILLHPQVDPISLASDLTGIIRDRKIDAPVKDVFRLQPLQNIHLYSNLLYEIKVTGNGKNIWILMGISILILVLAWANYFNISTSTTLDQSKAIGIRKVIGATKFQIISQLWLENLIYTAMGLALGLVMAAILIPIIEYYFNLQLSVYSIFENTLFNPLTVAIAFIFIGTISSSLLPALAMSSFPLVQIFRKSFNISGFSLNIRKGLVLVQFTAIISLMAGSMIILKQTQYMGNQDPGMDMSNILVVKGPLGTSVYENPTPAHIKFRNELNAIPVVTKIAMSHQVPGNSMEIVHDVTVQGEDGFVSVNRDYGTPSFFEVYGLQFLAGGVPEMAKEEDERIVINKAAMHLMGFRNPDQILNKQLSFWEKDYIITGVIENHHHLSLHHPVSPTVFDIGVERHMEDGYFSIKMSQNDYGNSLAQIRKAYESAFPNTVFEYFDLEEHYNQQYKADNDFKVLNIAFTGLALFISCIGLFGLSMIIIKNRFKEIAIRKVLGSSVKGIVSLLSRQFIKLIFLGWIISIPITWYALDTWLQNFTYRISIQWWVFVVALCLAIGITLLTTSINSIKAAMVNPVKSLRGD